MQSTHRQAAHHFIIQDGRILIYRTGSDLQLCKTLPQGLTGKIVYQRPIGLRQNDSHIVFELAGAQPESSTEFVDLRSLLGSIPDQDWLDAGRALQIIRWHRDHQYCSRCGRPIRDKTREIVKTCDSCSFIAYPRLSPAVIMSIIDDDRILLGRSAHFSKGMYSTLAGYVEPGETMEQAVAREIMEEVGIQVDDITYMGSQPWPFPHSMMVAFTTRFVNGDVQVDSDELEDARWFTRDTMPERLPIKGSIARMLIEHFLNQTGG